MEFSVKYSRFRQYWIEKNDTREYLLDSTDVDKLNLLEKAEDGSTAWCTDTSELYIKHNGEWKKQKI